MTNKIKKKLTENIYIKSLFKIFAWIEKDFSPRLRPV